MLYILDKVTDHNLHSEILIIHELYTQPNIFYVNQHKDFFFFHWTRYQKFLPQIYNYFFVIKYQNVKDIPRQMKRVDKW